MSYSGQIQGCVREVLQSPSQHYQDALLIKNHKNKLLKIALPIILGGAWVALMVGIHVAFPPVTALTVSMLHTTSYSTYLLGLGAFGAIAGVGIAGRSLFASIKSKYFGLNVSKFISAQFKLDQAWKQIVKRQKSFFKTKENNFTFFASVQGCEGTKKILKEYFDFDFPQKLSRFLPQNKSKQFLNQSLEFIQDLLDRDIQELQKMREEKAKISTRFERQNIMIHELIDVLAFIEFIGEVSKDSELLDAYKVYRKGQPKIYSPNPEKEHLQRLRLLTPFESDSI
ncbi:MAG TPA: hypothetical protein P5048_02875 [Chlamydiales bacterium]|nr:hypothetical protein [Chlamydiales bacterium]